MQHTKGEWEKVYISGVCIGIGVRDSNDGWYKGEYRMLCNSILPETDEEYKEEKGEIEDTMNKMTASKDMYEALEQMVESYVLMVGENAYNHQEIIEAKKALQKAKGEDNEAVSNSY